MPSKKRKAPTFGERSLGIQGLAKDYFTNMAARTGFGTPSLAEGASYELIRLSYNYWELITLYRNHWISRRIVDTPAKDMVKAWPTLTGDMKPEDMKKIDKAIRRTQTKTNMLTAMKWARLFGGAGCLIVIDGQEKELDQPLDLDSIELGAYKGLIPFDRWAGINPEGEVCNDISRPLDFNKPEHYSVRAVGGADFKVHSSRILRFLGPEVPTPEREAQSWWGISVLEPAYEEIKKRDNMSWNILSLTFRANIMGMKYPELAALMSGLGTPSDAGGQLARRLSQINQLMSNQSLIPLPKDGGLESSQYSFAGLSDCYQQFQLDISGASEIPVTRLWGRTISGLGQSNDADERIYEEKISSDQEELQRPQLEKLYPVICMSELGEVPEDMDFDFPSVRVLDEKEKSELAKATVDSVAVCINTGIFAPYTGGKEIQQASKISGFGTNLTDEDVDKLSKDVQSESELGAGLFGEEGEGGAPQLDPASGPQKVLREEGKVKGKGPQAVPGKGKGKAADSDDPGVGTYKVHGMDVVVETPRGERRSGKGFDVQMPAHYGYIKGVKGADGDSLDAYLGPDPTENWVYVCDQRHLPPRRGFDEHKVMMGFPSQAEALRAYDAGHHRAKDVLMDFTPMHVRDFKEWIRTGDLSKPCGEVRA